MSLAGSGPEGGAAEGQPELPEWRHELSRRLQEIKLRREGIGPNSGASQPAVVAPEPGPVGSSPAEESDPVLTKAPRRPRRVARASVRDFPEPIFQTTESIDPVSAPAVEPEPQMPTVAAQTPEPPPPAPAAADRVLRSPVAPSEVRLQVETRDMIDAAVARQASLPPHEPLLHESRTRPATEDPSAARPEPPAQFEAKPVLQARPALKPNPVPAQEPPLKPEPAPKPEPRLPLDIRPPVRVIPEPAPKPEPRLPPDMRPPVRVIPEPEPIPSPFPALLPEPREDKLILLTRTLAGLVDFIVVVLCAGLMILAVDILEGIDVFDTVSRIHYGVLFLLMYFVYSIFFLAMAGQTIGMMLTDVRMIGASSERVSLPRILIRCFVFLAGVAAAGIGLLWGCFDGEARCLHDLMSRTKVIRVLQDI